MYDSAVMGVGANQDIAAAASAGSMSNPMVGAAVRQAIAELEGHGYKYHSFVDDCAHTHVSAVVPV